MGDIAQVLANLEEAKLYDLVDRQIDEGANPLDIVKECNDGMVRVGDLFSQGTYFISQLIFAAEILKNVMGKLDPLLAGIETGDSNRGKVVIGTVKGDIHDIGKNLVITLLKGAGFDVIDLGVDVPPERFVDAVKESGATVVGLSAPVKFYLPRNEDGGRGL